MGAPGLTSPIRSETFQNLQLNAGIFIKNLVYDSITDAAELKTLITNIVTGASAAEGKGTMLGATRGGGTFVVTREIREPDVDGRRYPFKGGKFVDSADARLTTTLIEVTPDALVLALGNGEANTPSGSKVTTIKMHTAIESTDYITNICWVGDIADGRMVLILLENALNTADFSLTFTDKGEGTLPVELHAHQANVNDYDYAPFKIMYFDKAS